MAPGLAADGVLAGKRVLVIEDEFIVAAMVAEALEHAGAIPLGPVGRVDDALQAIGSVRLGAPRIDAAVLDWNLCGDPGLPVAIALAGQAIPFVIATGYGSVEPAFADRPLLAKPYAEGDLLAKLAALFAA
ncbi:MAG: response regulator [Novosphingobium sp.]